VSKSEPATAVLQKYLQSCSSNRRSKIRTLKKSASHLGGALSNLASHLGEATFIEAFV
jgi:hypothetical protein